MAIFEYTTQLPYPRETVFEWFARPGALPRLSAPFLGTIRQEPDKGLEVGSRAVMDVAAPGTLGTALAAATGLGAKALGLPNRVGARVPWHAKHISLNPGRDFTDIMESGPLARWEHQHFFADDANRAGPGTVMRDVVEFELPVLNRLPLNHARRFTEKAFRRELIQVFRYRERMLRADLAFRANYSSKPMVIAVAGASGVIGTQLCALLGGAGHRIIRLVRDRAGANGDDTVFWDPQHGVLDPAELREVDAVVNLAGHSIGGRFTEVNKEKIRSSRVQGTGLLARALATLAADGKQRSYIVASAIGIYGANPHTEKQAQPLAEDTAPGTGFLAEVCRDWEAACVPAAEAGVRVVNVRTGLVQTPAGGILQQVLPLYALGLGGPLGADAWQSWIGIDDVVGIYAHALLTDSLSGPVNAVAPSPVRAKDYARILGKVVRRPARIQVPALGPKLLLGPQGAAELAFADQRVSSTRVEASGYRFRQPDLESALRHVLGHS